MAQATNLLEWYYEALNTGLLISAELGEDNEEPPTFTFGGSCWVWDAAAPDDRPAWRLFLNRWAVDPATASALEPEKVELLREQVLSLVNAFPATLPHLERLGCSHARHVLHHPITKSHDVVVWAHSIWNAAVPAEGLELPDQPTTMAAALEALGFTVVHLDVQGDVAVLPAEGLRTRVYWASPGSDYVRKIGECLGPRHPVSLKAYGRKTKEKIHS